MFQDVQQVCRLSINTVVLIYSNFAVIHFLSAFPPFRGGISKFSDYLYNHISQHTQISAWNYKKLYPNFLFPGITQYLKEGETYSNRLIHSFNPLMWPFSSRKVPGSPDDILMYSHWHPFFAPSMKYHTSRFKKNGGKVIGLFHNVIPHESFPFQDRIIRKLLETTDQAILLSSQTKNELVELAPDTPSTTLFHPIYDQEPSSLSSKEIRKEYGIAEDEFVVLFFGLIRAYKGLDILIKAFNQMGIQEKKIRPLIVGEFYMDKTKILSGINQSEKDHYIVKDEFVTDEVMAEVFKISDITVLPYITASQSGILSNAINFKTPAIVSNHPGLTEYIQNDKNGLVLEENTPECLANSIKKAMDFQVRTRWKKELAHTKEAYSWKVFTKKLLEQIS